MRRMWWVSRTGLGPVIISKRQRQISHHVTSLKTLSSSSIDSFWILGQTECYQVNWNVISRPKSYLVQVCIDDECCYLCLTMVTQKHDPPPLPLSNGLAGLWSRGREDQCLSWPLEKQSLKIKLLSPLLLGCGLISSHLFNWWEQSALKGKRPDIHSKKFPVSSGKELINLSRDSLMNDVQ